MLTGFKRSTLYFPQIVWLRRWKKMTGWDILPRQKIMTENHSRQTLFKHQAV
jgi:hypothetical protein